MAIRSFKDKDTESFFNKGILPRKKGWFSLIKIVRRKLDMIHYSKNITDLKSPPNNHLECLKGKLKGFYSIRINNQWRIIFQWDGEPYNVKIIDYH